MTLKDPVESSNFIEYIVLKNRYILLFVGVVEKGIFI